MVGFSCPVCGSQLRIRSELAGNISRCSNCGSAVEAPALKPAAARVADNQSPQPAEDTPPANEQEERSANYQPSPDTQVTADHRAANPQVTTDHVSDEKTQPTDLPTRAARYRIVSEVARGGMGAVLRAHDPELDRTLAVKMMLTRHREKPELEQRFLDEARITGKLQHPGIPPVHELGRLEDGRPFFAMKLIEGETLAHLLKDRESGIGNREPESTGSRFPAPDSRFLHIFEQICQTIAYAHSQRVIHRDLKPLNIMVGAFGEVQVMDWGLAKPLDSSSTETSRRATAAHDAIKQVSDSAGTVDFVSLLGRGHETAAGAILGTPAYMAPEQARGEIDQLDTRTDVFGLGAILCEILTGAPAFAGKELPARLQQAQNGDLSDAWARLDACGADQELIDLCKKSLAPNKEERLHTASAVAEKIAAYRAGVEERLRKAERDQAVSAAEAREQCKRRKVQFALSAALLLIVAGGGAFAWWQENQSAERRATEARLEGERDSETRSKVDQARQGVRANLALARDLRRQYKFRDAGAAVVQAAKLAGSGAPELLVQVKQAQSDLAFLIQLDDIRYRKWVYIYRPGGVAYPNTRIASPEYHKAFTDRGLNLKTMNVDHAASRITASAVKDELVAAVDDWALHEEDKSIRIRLLEIARRADPDSWRDRLRDEAAWHSKAAIAKLVAEVDPAATSPESLTMLANRMWALNLDASKLFATARAQYPSDFNLAFTFGYWHEITRRQDGQIGAFEAARALRPDNASVWGGLGINLLDRHDLSGAITALRKAVQLDPTFAPHYYNLGSALREKRDLEGAFAAFSDGIKIDPTLANMHNGLGATVERKGDVARAILHYREAIRCDEYYSLAHNNLGAALFAQDDLEGAEKAIRKAIDLDPNFALAHYNLGNLLSRKKNLNGAIKEYGEAIRLDRKYHQAYFNLGNELSKTKDWQGAIKAYRASMRLNANDLKAHSYLMLALIQSRDFAGAVTASREAAKLKPKSADDRIVLSKVYDYRGLALKNQGKLADALTAYKEAVRINPKNAEAHVNLGTVLGLRNDVDGAIAAYEEAIKHNPKLADARFSMGVALSVKGERDGAIAQIKLGVKLAPNDDYGHRLLAAALLRQGDVPGAQAALKEAARINPKWKSQLEQFLRIPATSLKVTGHVENETKTSGDLTDKAPLYFGCFYKHHVAKLQMNHFYTVELRSKKFDTFLVLFDPTGKKRLAQNDDVIPTCGDLSRLTFLAPKTADYVIRVTTAKSKETGSYTLRILDHGARTVFRGSLSDDTKERKHELKMTAAKTYAIEMESKQFDTFLRLQDAKGNKLDENDDIDARANNLNSRIYFTPKKDGVYRIIATSYQQRGQGAYTLVIREFRKEGK